MDAITELTTINFSSIIIGIFLIMSALVTVYEIIGKFSVIIGKPIKKYKQREQDHELVMKNYKTIKELSKRQEEDKKQSIIHDKKIEDKLENLTELFIQKEIADMRWELLDFCSALSGGRKYNRETFNHIFSVYENYEKILEENGMENGLVDESMKYIKDIYHELLKSGELK